MADFFRVLARLLAAAAPNEQELDEHPDELWAAHQHATGRHRLEQLVRPQTAEWLPGEVQQGTAAWNKVTPKQPAHDINEPANSELIQSAAEAASALQRKRFEAQRRVKENPRANPEEY